MMEDRTGTTPADTTTRGVEDWTSWTKEELERQYSPSRWSPYSPPSSIIEEYVATATRDITSCRAELKWGTHPVSKIDADDSDIVMDVYGEDLPAGRVADMAKEVYRGVLEARRTAQEKTWGAGVLMGWSAGAQLVLQALLHFNDAAEGTPPSAGGVRPGDWIRGVVAVSGVFLLTPLVQTYVNEPLHLSRSEAWQLSPLNPASCRGLRARLRHEPNFLIAVADNDSPSFREQSKAYSQMLRSSGFRSVAERTVASSDHFRIVSELSDPSNFFCQVLLKFVQQCNNG